MMQTICTSKLEGFDFLRCRAFLMWDSNLVPLAVLLVRILAWPIARIILNSLELDKTNGKRNNESYVCETRKVPWNLRRNWGFSRPRVWYHTSSATRMKTNNRISAEDSLTTKACVVTRKSVPRRRGAQWERSRTKTQSNQVDRMLSSNVPMKYYILPLVTRYHALYQTLREVPLPRNWVTNRAQCLKHVRTNSLRSGRNYVRP